MGLTLLRNKDKNTYVRAVASSLAQKVTIAENVALDIVSQDDVSVTNDQWLADFHGQNLFIFYCIFFLPTCA